MKTKKIQRARVFALHPVQQDLVDKYCFNKCGKISIGELVDKKLGAMFPCNEEKCPYEEKSMALGSTSNRQIVWIRKLKAENK